jgi:5-hydroxyisourate hydrolase
VACSAVIAGSVRAGSTWHADRYSAIPNPRSINMAGGVSLHAVDVARGVPAQGMRVELWALAPTRRLVAEGLLGTNGQLDHPSVQGDGVETGSREALFHVGDYLRAHGGGDASPFLDVLPFRFQVAWWPFRRPVAA